MRIIPITSHRDSKPAQARATTDPPSLASFQTQLALDRTTLAWVRTTLTMASFGFGMVAFFRSRELDSPGSESRFLHHEAVRFGTAVIVLGIVATIVAAVSQWHSLRRLRRGETPPLRQWPLSLALALLFAIVSLAGLWALLSR